MFWGYHCEGAALQLLLHAPLKVQNVTLLNYFRVCELLSVHYIGQRLFAKYVLGLSQGTVSELLSISTTCPLYYVTLCNISEYESYYQYTILVSVCLLSMFWDYLKEL